MESQKPISALLSVASALAALNPQERAQRLNEPRPKAHNPDYDAGAPAQRKAKRKQTEHGQRANRPPAGSRRRRAQRKRARGR